MVITANKVIKIVHLVHKFQAGGLENGIVNLVNRLDEERYEHVIIALTEVTNFKNRLKRPVKCIALNKQPGHSFKIYWQLYKLFTQLKPDVVHTRNIATIEAQIPALLAGVKYRIHGEHGWDTHDFQGNNKKYNMLRKLCKLGISEWVALSSEQMRFLENKISVNKKKLNHIINGVDIDCFSPDKRNVSLLPSGFNEKFIIGTVGRLETIKNQR